MHHGVNGQSRYGLDAQLLHDVLAVGDDGGEADVQFVGNLFVDEPFGDEYQLLFRGRTGRGRRRRWRHGAAWRSGSRPVACPDARGDGRTGAVGEYL